MIKRKKANEIVLFSYPAFVQELEALADPAYRKFHLGIMKTQYYFYGVSTPKLKKMATAIFKTGCLPFLEYAEENGFDSYEQLMIFGLLLGKMKDGEELEEHIPYFLEAVDNWAICDQTASAMRFFSKNREEYLDFIYACLEDDRPYVRRFAFSCLIFQFKTVEYAGPALAAALENQESLLCVSAAKAWLFQTFYTIVPEEVRLALFQGIANGQMIGLPDEKTKKRTLQKMRDSLRVSDEDKQLYFRG